MKDKFEEVIMGLILSAGNAKSLAIQAYREARDKNFEEATKLIAKADEEMNKAHEIQTNLIQDEVNGKSTSITLLSVHAQDHTMTAMTVIDLVREMIITMMEEK